MRRTLPFYLSFLLLGCFSQLTQILISRELLVVFFGNEVTFGVFFGSWLFWIGVGGILVARFSGRIRSPSTPFLACLAILPFALIGEVLAVRLCRRVIEVSPSEFIPFGQMVLLVWILSLPVSLLVGLCFPLGCKTLREESAISRVYVIESSGSLLAGIAFTFLLVHWVGPWRTAFLTGFLQLLHLVLHARDAKAGTIRRLAVGTAGLFLLLLVTPLGRRVETWTDRLRWRTMHPRLELLESIDTPYQNVSVARLGSQYSVAGNGKIDSSFPDPILPAARAALFYSQNPAARKILMIGGAAGGLIPELLEYPVETIDCVEQDRGALETVRPYFPGDWRRSFADPRLRFHFLDGRLFLNRLPETRKYDLILSAAPDPSTAQINRFYTVEFFLKVRGALGPGGVFVAAVSSASNYLGREVKSYSGSVFRTLREVFPEVAVSPGDVNYFFASPAPGGITLDAAELARRYESVPLARRKFSSPGFATLIPQERVGFLRTLLEEQEIEPNRDVKPVTYYLNMLLWGKFTGSRFVRILEGMRSVRITTLALPLLFFVLLRFLFNLTESDRGRRGRFTASLSIASIGFAAMSIQIILLYAYQSFFGYIYRRIGILNGLFMFGLALGAVLGRYLLDRRGKREGWWLWAGLCGCGLFSLAIPPTIGLLPGLRPSFLEAGFLGFAALSGAITGTAFPFAIAVYHRAAPEAGRSSGTIHAADHFGGALGGILSGAFLVPLFGISPSCRLIAFCLFLVSLLILQHQLQGSAAALRLADALPRRIAGGLRARAFVSFPARRLSWILFGTAATVLVISTIARGTLRAPMTRFGDEILTEVSGSSDFEFRDAPFPHYLGRSPGLEDRTLSFSTLPVAGEVKGYAGPLNLLLSLSEDAEILGVVHVESDETPSYVHGIDGWLERLRGKSIRTPLRLGAGIDAMSGATISSRAAIETINRAALRGGNRVLDWQLSHGPAESGRHWAAFLGTPKGILITLLLAAFFPVFFLAREIPRQLYLAASFLVLGVAFNSLVTMIDIGNLSLGRLPGAGNPYWYLLGGFVVLTSLLWGQVYCGYVCPFGALQELLWGIGRIFGFKAYAIRWLDQWARYFKFVLVAAVLVLFWVTESTRWISFNPMQYVFSWNWSRILVIMTVIVLAASVFYFRFWCRYFCPAGAILALFNKIALLQAMAPKRVFHLCDLGVKAEYDVDCIQCTRCVYARRKVADRRPVLEKTSQEGP